MISEILLKTCSNSRILLPEDTLSNQIEIFPR
jgi:hypothetical protein